MAPTYFRREPGIDGSNGQAAPHLHFLPGVSPGSFLVWNGSGSAVHRSTPHRVQDISH